MRETGPVRFILGDGSAEQQPQAALYIPVARVILGQVKNRMRLGGLQQLAGAITLDDGTVIQVASRFGQDFATILPVIPASPPPPAPPEVAEEPVRGKRKIKIPRDDLETWTRLADGPAKFGHQAIFDPDTQTMWVWSGYDRSLQTIDAVAEVDTAISDGVIHIDSPSGTYTGSVTAFSIAATWTWTTGDGYVHNQLWTESVTITNAAGADYPGALGVSTSVVYDDDVVFYDETQVGTSYNVNEFSSYTNRWVYFISLNSIMRYRMFQTTADAVEFAWGDGTFDSTPAQPGGSARYGSGSGTTGHWYDDTGTTIGDWTQGDYSDFFLSLDPNGWKDEDTAYRRDVTTTPHGESLSGKTDLMLSDALWSFNLATGAWTNHGGLSFNDWDTYVSTLASYWGVDSSLSNASNLGGDTGALAGQTYVEWDDDSDPANYKYWALVFGGTTVAYDSWNGGFPEYHQRSQLWLYSYEEHGEIEVEVDE